ncbi:MAG: lipase family protein [Nocardioidaceae bacterium]
MVGRVGGLVVVAGLLMPLGITGGVVSSNTVPVPSKDSFYRYDGSTPLREVPPGTPLRERQVHLALGTASTPRTAEQILYRTTNAAGSAVASVTTVLLPDTSTADPRVVGYLSFYDALTSRCDPSYTLRGGNPGSANEQNADIEQAVVNSLNAEGYIVTVPDFEDEALDYVSGIESGTSSLDGIRATLRWLRLPAKRTPVALMGYSGGSIAADWASELAPRYTPDLHLVGVAAGGIPVDLAHNLAYVNGSPSWSDVMPAAMIGIARSYHLRLRHYLSAFGRQVVRVESHECIGQFLGKWPGLTVAKLMKPRYRDLIHVPVFTRILNSLIMGSLPGHPTEPLLMVAGKSDNTGDGVMVTGDEDALAYEYCHQGVPVDFQVLDHADHDNAGLLFMPLAMTWLASRFAGLPAPDNCALIPPGNSLKPIRNRK